MSRGYHPAKSTATNAINIRMQSKGRRHAGVERIDTFGYGHGVRGRRLHVLRKAAADRVAGVDLLAAERLSIRDTVLAASARPAEPPNSNAHGIPLVSWIKALDEMRGDARSSRGWVIA